MNNNVYSSKKIKNLKKILLLCLFLIFTFLCASCSKTTSTITTKEETSSSSTYSLRVTDIDDSILLDERIEVDKYDNLYLALKDNSTLVDSANNDGTHYILSINNSIVDSAYSLMTYVNGAESWLANDNIIPIKDDVIEIKNVCWKAIDYGYGVTYDDIDVLIDKTIYNYAKTYLKLSLESCSNYTGSTYWELLFLDMYKNAGYDMNQINISYKDELKSSISNTDVSSLSGVNLMKYYLHAKAVNMLSSNFNQRFKSVMDSQTTFDNNVTPFLISVDSYVNSGSESLDTLKNSSITGSTSQGPDINMWKYISINLIENRKDALNITTYVKKWDNVTSDMVVVSGFSSVNEDIRDKEKYGVIKDSNNKDCDYIEYIFNTYYDSELNLIKYNTSDTGINQSTNQIYLYLLSYKVMRDYNRASNIFGNK